jgi:hypothetical protein
MGVARRFRHTPREYRCERRREPDRAADDARPTVPRRPSTCLTPLKRRPYHPPDDERAER